MIHPDQLTNFNRTRPELEELWLFSVAVAGKPALRIARQLDKFLGDIKVKGRPFTKVQTAMERGELENRVLGARFGQHTRIARAYRESLELDLRRATVDELDEVHGVGPKTARMFVLHTRPNQRLAVLDTHILQHLGELGHDVPSCTPTGKTYARLEGVVLDLADAAGMSPADYDLHVWKSRRHDS